MTSKSQANHHHKVIIYVSHHLRL